MRNIIESFTWAEPNWFWGLLFIPVLAWLYWKAVNVRVDKSRISAYADPELLPYLSINTGYLSEGRKTYHNILTWAGVCVLGLCAMAGPRWDFEEVETFAPDISLLIVLDLSQSMNVTDIKPSRLANARFEIEDILAADARIKIGLIVYAAEAHVVSPLTDDRDTIRLYLSSLSTDLVQTQGSDLPRALYLADRLLQATPAAYKSILVISDGENQTQNTERMISNLVSKGISVNTLGVGTLVGGPVPDGRGNWQKDKYQKVVISRLGEESLMQLAEQTGGIYLRSDFRKDDTQMLVEQVTSHLSAVEKKPQKIKVWNEHFYLLILPALALMVFWFKRGFVFLSLLILLSPDIIRANESFFYNQNQQAEKQYLQKNYENAAVLFTDAYQRGVAKYRAGKYAEAEKEFSSLPENSPDQIAAEYNLGNTFFMREKFHDAIKHYESVLKKNPQHEDARHNLELAKRMIKNPPPPEVPPPPTTPPNPPPTTPPPTPPPPPDQPPPPSEQPPPPDVPPPETPPPPDAPPPVTPPPPPPEQPPPPPPPSGSGDSSTPPPPTPSPSTLPEAKKINPQGNEGEEKSGNADGEEEQFSSEKPIDPGRLAPMPGDNHHSQVEHSSTKAEDIPEVDGEQWLDQATSNPKDLLKEQFRIKELNAQIKQPENPW